MRRPKSKKRHRYANIFNDMGADWEAIVNARDTSKEVRFIESVLSNEGMVLDLCCGTGRHSVALCKQGWKAIGIDLSKNLLAIAKLRIKRARVRFPLIRADMRFFPFRDNLFSAIELFGVRVSFCSTSPTEITLLRRFAKETGLSSNHSIYLRSDCWTLGIPG